MTATTTEAGPLVECAREAMGPLTHVVPDVPWTTTTLQAMQNRKAVVHVDVPQRPANMVVLVRGGDAPGDHDQAYVFGASTSEGLRAYVAGVSRPTEFIVDESLSGMILDVHPGATTRDAMCCWFERLELPAVSPTSAPVRRLRASDVDALCALVPPWAFRTFESPKDMILSGACFAVELNGKIASVAYVADKSIKYARIAVATAAPFRRKHYGYAAARRLMEHLANDGRLVCALAPRTSAQAVHFAVKLGFPQKALLRTYKVVPGAETAQPAAPAAAPTPA
jgi:hypothetical protein